MNIQRSFNPSDHEQISKSGTKSGILSGTLYLVGTPIGNLEDISFRAVRTLKEVHCIAAEDTRHTRKLLTHFEISTRLISYHEHNKRSSGPELIRMLSEGDSIALVSDAGIPAISDPGYDLVCLAIEHNIAVVPIPGANAALSALIISGLPTGQFIFAGFLPRDVKHLNLTLERLKSLTETIILYESPHRLSKTIDKLQQCWGDREAAVIREITKKYEEALRGKLSECRQWLEQHPPKGEYCIIVKGISTAGLKSEQESWWQPLTIQEHIQHYIDEGGDRKEALKLAAIDRKVPKRELYNQLLTRD